MAGGQLKEVRTRIQSVNSTQQITKAMKMVSAAKLRRAQEAIWQMRPYSEKLSEILGNIVAGLEGEVQVGFAKEREINKVLIVLITSDKGLCGAFNSNSIKKAKALIEGKYSQQAAAGNLRLLCMGKKGYVAFRKTSLKIIDDYVQIFNELSFDKAAEVAEFIMNGFTAQEFDKVELVYGQFRNAATQVFLEEPFLPIPKFEQDEAKSSKSDYIFEPNKKDIIEYLIPKILKTQLFKALLDSNASEHGARMTAMDKATENANELLKGLKISYNRARQAAITTELTEIVGGAAALESS